MRRLMFLALSASSAGCTSSGTDSGGGGNGEHPALSLTGNATTGATVFTDSCGDAKCHGPDGMGTDVPAEDLNAKVPGLSDAEIVTIIDEGYLQMPPQSALSDQDIADVLAYLRETFGS